MPTLTLAEAVDLISRALTRCRTSPHNAAIVARALVAAEADSLVGHGLARVPTYAAQAKAGKVDGFATPQTEQRRSGVAAIDARNGFAYPALDVAVALLPALARHTGIAAAAIRRSHHAGAAGHPVERLAEAGLVALMFANTPGAIAPWGGSQALFGTNPIAFACPLPGRAPIVVDLSLTQVTRGQIMLNVKAGKPIPDGWGMDRDGNPTNDAQKILVGGSLYAVGGLKGTMLALAVELICCALTGAALSHEVASMHTNEGPPLRLGQSFIAIDPGALAGSEVYFERVETLVAAILADEGVRLPGDRRHALAAAGANEGLNIDGELLTQLQVLARGAS